MPYPTTTSVPTASAGSTIRSARGLCHAHRPRASTGRYSRSRIRSSCAAPSSEPHEADSPTQIVSSDSPPRARPAAAHDSARGRPAATAAKASSTHATTAATVRGPSKKPPALNASTVGPASRASWRMIRAHAEARPGGVDGLSGAPRKSAILPIVRPRLLALALFLGAALISGFSIRRGIDPFDEGLMLSTVDRILRGQTPYQDFIWPYGPGQPYLLAGAAELLDRSLLWWRIVRVAADAGVALLVFTMLRGRVPLWLALAGWLCAACAMAQPVSANPFPIALLAGLGAFAVITARPPGRRAWLWAGLLCAMSAAWRLDFGLYAAGAAGLAILLRPEATGAERAKEAARFAAAAVVAGLVLYAPFLIAAGPAEMYDQLVATAGRERDYWTLPFPLEYDGAFSLWPPGTAAEGAKDVLGYYVPLLVLVGVALAAVCAAVAGRTRGAWLAGAVALGAGGAVYMYSRADEFHSAPGVVALALALPVCVYAGRKAGRAGTVAGRGRPGRAGADHGQRGAQPRVGAAATPALRPAGSAGGRRRGRPPHRRPRPSPGGGRGGPAGAARPAHLHNGPAQRHRRIQQPAAVRADRPAERARPRRGPVRPPGRTRHG